MRMLLAMLLAAFGIVAFGSVGMAGKKGGTRSGASATNTVVVHNAPQDGTGNLSQEHWKKLIEKVAEIRRFLAKSSDTNAVRLVAFADELAKEVKAKKYGLVFEEHKEKIDVQLERSLPLLTEDKDRFIDNGGELNFLIEGDNLAALRLLEKTHRDKIDLIYIDPPYNTGNKDFMYNDSYVDANDTFRHSKWLSFMKKRLEIARNILANDGAIFISIDDNEQAALKLLCDEVFVANNFIAEMIWQQGKKGSGNLIGTNHEYMTVYAKNRQVIDIPERAWRQEKLGLEKIYGKYRQL